ncbi:hypothetical protein LTR85_003622 [Meristemomyces frigidus]|nr:hypothetical protein LTR85_003622 [Meristemomyces frigidus]
MASSSPILRLPRELRDNIYGYIVLHEPPIPIAPNLPAVRAGLFASKATIILASKQIHEEYLETLDKTASSPKHEAALQTKVMNSDFSNLITFVNHLSASELSTITEHSRLHIKFVFPSADKELSTEDGVKRIRAWLELQSTTGVATNYEVDTECVRERDDLIVGVSPELLCGRGMAKPFGEEGRIYKTLQTMLLLISEVSKHDFFHRDLQLCHDQNLFNCVMALSSPLLMIPRELRNSIYELLILDTQPIRLRKNVGADLPRISSFAVPSSIIPACDQMHDEYLDSLDQVALSASFPDVVVETSVTDFNFQSLLYFTSKLPADNVKLLEKHFKLNVSTSPSLRSAGFLRKPSKSDSRCDYEFDGVHYYGYRVVEYLIFMSYAAAREDEGREARKVYHALQSWSGKWVTKMLKESLAAERAGHARRAGEATKAH